MYVRVHGTHTYVDARGARVSMYVTEITEERVGGTRDDVSLPLIRSRALGLPRSRSFALIRHAARVGEEGTRSRGQSRCVNDRTRAVCVCA